MSEMLLSFLISVGILAAMFVFVPMLHVCNAGCQRLFGRREKAARMEAAAGQQADGSTAQEAA